jgi:hypothetical protein
VAYFGINQHFKSILRLMLLKAVANMCVNKFLSQGARDRIKRRFKYFAIEALTVFRKIGPERGCKVILPDVRRLRPHSACYTEHA